MWYCSTACVTRGRVIVGQVVMLPLVFMALALWPMPAGAQSPIANGATQLGAITIGGLDTYTFQAGINDSITIRLGEVLGAGPDPLFSPRIRLLGVDNAVLGDSSAASAAEIDVRAPLTGTYTLLVSQSPFAAAQTATGNYALTLAKTPGPYAVSAGDEGGLVTNGATHVGVIQIGDLDTYTFQAGINDSMTIRIGEIRTSEVDPLFTPRIRLRGPDGAPLGDTSGANAGEIDVRAPLTGTYTVLVTHSVF